MTEPLQAKREHDAAIFLLLDSGEAGFPERFYNSVQGNHDEKTAAMFNAFDAIERSGAHTTTLEPGDLKITRTPTGATCVAAIAIDITTHETGLSVRVDDQHGRPIGNLAIRATFSPDNGEVIGVTNIQGMITTAAMGDGVTITFGQQLPELTLPGVET